MSTVVQFRLQTLNKIFLNEEPFSDSCGVTGPVRSHEVNFGICWWSLQLKNRRLQKFRSAYTFIAACVTRAFISKSGGTNEGHKGQVMSEP